MITDAPDAREGGLVEGGRPIGTRHKRGALGVQHILGDGAGWDGVGHDEAFGLAHHALEVNVGLVPRPLP